MPCLTQIPITNQAKRNRTKITKQRTSVQDRSGTGPSKSAWCECLLPYLVDEISWTLLLALPMVDEGNPLNRTCRGCCYECSFPPSKSTDTIVSMTAMGLVPWTIPTCILLSLPLSHLKTKHDIICIVVRAYGHYSAKGKATSLLTLLRSWAFVDVCQHRLMLMALKEVLTSGQMREKYVLVRRWQIRTGILSHWQRGWLMRTKNCLSWSEHGGWANAVRLSYSHTVYPVPL